MSQNAINSTEVLLQRVKTSTGALVTCSTTIPADNTIPQNTEGTQILTLSITPKFSTSKLVIDFSSPITQSSTGSGGPTVALFQDSNVNAIAARSIQAASSRSCGGGFKHIMTSGTTSSTTFKIRIGSNANTCYVNGDSSGTARDGGVANTNLTISEYL
jgi:hypothetical protein